MLEGTHLQCSTGRKSTRAGATTPLRRNNPVQHNTGLYKRPAPGQHPCMHSVGRRRSTAALQAHTTCAHSQPEQLWAMQPANCRHPGRCSTPRLTGHWETVPLQAHHHPVLTCIATRACPAGLAHVHTPQSHPPWCHAHTKVYGVKGTPSAHAGGILHKRLVGCDGTMLCPGKSCCATHP